MMIAAALPPLTAPTRCATTSLCPLFPCPTSFNTAFYPFYLGPFSPAEPPPAAPMLPSQGEEGSSMQCSPRPLRAKEVLHTKFSCAAAALTELYKESTDAYEAGYRDALLYVHRYILLTSVRAPPPRGEDSADAPHATSAPIQATEDRTEEPATGWAAAPTLCAEYVVASDKILRFMQNTMQRRRERVALERGTAERRRRPPPSLDANSCHLGDCDGTTDSEADNVEEANELTPSSLAPSPQHGEPSAEDEALHVLNAEDAERTREGAGVLTVEAARCRGRERVRLLAQLDDITHCDPDEPPRQQRRCFTPVAASRFL